MRIAQCVDITVYYSAMAHRFEQAGVGLSLGLIVGLALGDTAVGSDECNNNVVH